MYVSSNDVPGRKTEGNGSVSCQPGTGRDVLVTIKTCPTCRGDKPGRGVPRTGP
jgi:hypothetical protein